MLDHFLNYFEVIVLFFLAAVLNNNKYDILWIYFGIAYFQGRRQIVG